MIQVTYKGHMGNDLSVVNAARVSFGKESFGESIEYDLFHDDPDAIKASVVKYKEEGWVITTDVDDWKLIITKPTMGDAKLINYLAKHKHISPFGHCFASFHIKAPIFVARQLVKHKFLRWNEVSRRYVDSDPEFYEPKWRSRADNVKQGSGGPVEISLDAEMLYHATIRNALSTYDSLLEDGVAPEQARMVLPQNMMTEWWWSGSLDAFADMCALRCKPDTQAETAEVAWEIDCKMVELFPVSWRALRENY